MIQVFTNPLLLDYLKICIQMSEDERKHLEALTGYPYDIDGAAVGNFTAPGPKWVLKDGENNPLVVGGFVQKRPGVWQDYMLTSPQAWEKQYWFSVTRTCRRIMDSMFVSQQAHRLECITPSARMAQRPELWGWYELMKYKHEGKRRGYCADGGDAEAFARVA